MLTHTHTHTHTHSDATYLPTQHSAEVVHQAIHRSTMGAFLRVYLFLCMCGCVCVCVPSQVPFAACLSSWSGDEVVSDVWSAAAKKRCAATKRSRFATFPPFLVIALK